MLEKILPWSNEKKFWKWFVKHSDELFNFEADQQRIFDELATQLKKVHESLTFEFGPIQNNKREFIVSADGIRSAFPFVQKLVAISPKMDRWSVIPFRPPKGLMNSIQFEDYILYPQDVWFKHEKDGDRTGLVIYIKNFSENNEIQAKSAVFIMLDSALGEYNVETMVGFIEFMPLADRPDALGLLPFEKINDIFNLTFQ
jgi:hypothetical protein